MIYTFKEQGRGRYSSRAVSLYATSIWDAIKLFIEAHGDQQAVVYGEEFYTVHPHGDDGRSWILIGQDGHPQRRTHLLHIAEPAAVVTGLSADAVVSGSAWSTFEITDIPLVTGKEYDQFKFVSRKAARALARQDPDSWRIL